MLTRHHPLRGASLGSQRQITSFHFGPGKAAPGDAPPRKVYIQASLHADELPGMLVAHHLRQRLSAIEAQGRLRAEVVLVPVANPIGLGQTVLRRNEGRFELASGQNFNRHYPSLAPLVTPLIEGRLGADEAGNTALVRSAMREVIAAQPAVDELSHQRLTLLGLAVDAEVVLDLHCDSEALPHLYTGTPLWPQAEPLARLLGTDVQLLALESGDNPFDEACSQAWWQLAEQFSGRHPIAMACLSVTVELRGEYDVSHELAAQDADALINFLTHRGLVDGPAPVLPPLRQPATPLAGTEVLKAPASGVVVYRRALGEWLQPGDVVADVVDPLSGEQHPVATTIHGLLFTREAQRYTTAGRPLVKVAGAAVVRDGKLSSD